MKEPANHLVSGSRAAYEPINRDGLTFRGWLEAAGVTRPDLSHQRAWRLGEDPADYRAEPTTRPNPDWPEPSDTTSPWLSEGLAGVLILGLAALVIWLFWVLLPGTGPVETYNYRDAGSISREN